jgi:hypothetical protein
MISKRRIILEHLEKKNSGKKKIRGLNLEFKLGLKGVGQAVDVNQDNLVAIGDDLGFVYLVNLNYYLTSRADQVSENYTPESKY